MLFKLLKLFGLDVPAKVAAAKLVIEQRAEEVAQYVGQTVQTSAVIAALSALAGVLGAMAVGVGLYALYLVDADAYGVYAGLGVVGGVLVAAVLILLLVVWAKGQSLSRRRIFKPLSPSATAASSSASVVAAARPAPARRPVDWVAAFPAMPLEKTETLARMVDEELPAPDGLLSAGFTFQPPRCVPRSR